MGDIAETLEEMLMCSVCQDIFRDPRQLPCGHSVCLSCLENMMDHSSNVLFRCPDCRESFGPIVGVKKSYTLTNVAEELREDRRRRNKLASVGCDYCLETQTPAFKTCLRCEVSLCKEHLKEHLEMPVFSGHPLVSPLGDLAERKCPQHEDEVLRYYCRASRRYICNVCALDNKKHSLDTEASNLLRRHLTEYLELRFEMLKDQMTESTASVKKLQGDLQREKRGADSAVNSVTAVLLCLWFIVLYYAYCYSVENQTLKEALQKQESIVQNIFSSLVELLGGHPKESHKLPATEGFLLLDVDTANPLLGVSADLRTAERVKTAIAYHSSINRFDEAPQILSASCFSSGAHSWEVEAEGDWDMAVSYRSIPRKSKNSSTFGHNEMSWSLRRRDGGELSAYHDREKTVLSGNLQSGRIAVTVDMEKGNIAFFSVESAVTLLHEFRAELTEPVCLGLGLHRVDPPSRASIVKVS